MIVFYNQVIKSIQNENIYVKEKVDCNLTSLLESKNHNEKVIFYFYLHGSTGQFKEFSKLTAAHMQISKMYSDTIYTVTCRNTHCLWKTSTVCFLPNAQTKNEESSVATLFSII